MPQLNAVGDLKTELSTKNKVTMKDKNLNTDKTANSDLGAVRRSFSLEDLKKAFEAGDELVKQDWHEQEFCIGERCRCKGVKLKYSNFDEWVSQNVSGMVSSPTNKLNY